MLLIKAFIFLLLMLFSSSDECGSKFSSCSFIMYGGTTSSADQWPWLVRLFKIHKKEFFCSSTLISDKHLLTAAHCVKDMDNHFVRQPSSFFAMLGGSNISDLNDDAWIRRSISDVNVHEAFGTQHNTRLFDADIAVLTMSENVKFTSSIKKICLPSPYNKVHNIRGYAVGHGKNEENKLEDIAKFINITAISWQSCIFKDSQFNKILSERTFCAGGEERKVACHGDSGGGFYTEQDNVWTINGIISAAPLVDTNQCNENLPSIFTTVAKYVNWIKNILDRDQAPAHRVVINLNSFGLFNQEISFDAQVDRKVCTATLTRNSMDIGVEPIELFAFINSNNSNGLSLVYKFTSSVMSRIFFEQTTLKLSTDEQTRLDEILDKNYQNILTLQKRDGSFDLWNTNDRKDLRNSFLKSKYDNLDLTAFMVKVLTQYEKLNPSVDSSIITKALNYLKMRQKPDGSFRNNKTPRFEGLINDTNIDGVSLTAYILITLLENDNLKANYKELIDSALNFIDSKFYEILHEGTNYERALTFYLYILAKKDYQLMLTKLNTLGERSDGKVYWNLNKVESPPAVQVEISSYVVLGLTKLKKYEEANEIVKFLMTKRVAKGFISTSDTVLGLQALTEIAKAFYSKDTNINLSLSSDVSLNVGNFKKSERTILKIKKKLRIEAKGHGIGILDISC